ncbi:hypothetical protein A3F52_00865 [Candidatus Uhrbacteria bacterium RIFCSPHIGHO2_12_FULL_47_11]|nr:MAG: hypothetical protein A3F52_00865 [Candidatus Uhrbacteria bacterium RIFCSPHIGHO2_12_FULL_47_11]
MKENYIEECKIVQQNCTYTAETHHLIALSAKRKAFWFEVVPAVCAAFTSALVASGAVSQNLLPITVLSAAISAVAAVLNPNKNYQEHLSASRSFTALKHDARYLRESQSHRMADDVFALAVDQLHQRYNDLLKATPETDEKSFSKAREKVQRGIHEPDRDNRAVAK